MPPTRLLLSALCLACASARAGDMADDAQRRLDTWRVVTEALRDVDEAARVHLVNSYFNRVPQVSDQDLWGVRDYWATPEELLTANGGDCEDLASAKWATLRTLGVPRDRLRLSYAKAWIAAERRFESHLVLTYRPDPVTEPVVLDNLLPALLPVSRRRDLAITREVDGPVWEGRGPSGSEASEPPRVGSPPRP